MKFLCIGTPFWGNIYVDQNVPLKPHDAIDISQTDL